MNIKELKEMIKDLPDEMEIGVTDWFGRFVGSDKEDFGVDTPLLEKDKKFFRAASPYIGEEPEY